MAINQPSEQGAELGSLLRAWRARVQPADVGFRSGRDARRTPGLRREEVSWLAGVSADYIKRLEQGRAHPSLGIVRALARALQLSKAELELACRLAGHTAAAEGVLPQHVGPGVQRILTRLPDVPIAVFDAAWTMLTHNELWAALMRGTRGEHRWASNLVWRSFHGDDGRVRHRSLEQHQASLVADLRDVTARYPADRDLTQMIVALRKHSDSFASSWDDARVSHYREATKTIDHPHTGPIELDCDVMTVQDGDLRLIMFTAPHGSRAAEQLAMLAVLGLQDLGTSGRP